MKRVKIKQKGKIPRLFLEQHLYILFPVGLHLHHIDADKNNNTLENVIFLKRKMHKRVHKEIKNPHGCYLLERRYLILWLKEKNYFKTFLRIERKRSS